VKESEDFTAKFESGTYAYRKCSRGFRNFTINKRGYFQMVMCPLILSQLVLLLSQKQMNKINQINFRFFKKNMQSIAVLMPLVPGSDAVEKHCDGIMVYSFATQQAPSIFREVSKAGTRSEFIAGGPHPSARPEETLRFFDYVVIGEGEETLPELIDVIQNKGDISSVKGIAYKNETGNIVFTEKRSHVNLDNYPPFDPKIMLTQLRSPVAAHLIAHTAPHHNYSDAT